MSIEAAPALHENTDPLQACLTLLTGPAKLSATALTVLEPFRRTELAKRLSKSSFAKGVRVGAALLAMLPNVAGSKERTPEDYLKAGQTMQSMLMSAAKQRSATAQEAIRKTEVQIHVQALEKARIALTQFRTKHSYPEGSVESVAADIVIANIFDEKTSSLLQEMSSSDEEKPIMEKWIESHGIKNDFGTVYESQVMQDETMRSRLIDTMHEMYDDVNIKEMQLVVGDSRLMHNYEVIFRAMNQPEYKKGHEDRVRESAQALLAEGNLEMVVQLLRRSNANIFVEKFAGILSEYVPDAAILSNHDEQLPDISLNSEAAASTDRLKKFADADKQLREAA